MSSCLFPRFPCRLKWLSLSEIFVSLLCRSFRQRIATTVPKTPADHDNTPVLLNYDVKDMEIGDAERVFLDRWWTRKSLINESWKQSRWLEQHLLWWKSSLRWRTVFWESNTLNRIFSNREIIFQTSFSSVIQLQHKTKFKDKQAMICQDSLKLFH